MSKMSLMSRSKFGSSSTFIDDSEVLFSSTTGLHGGGSDDVDAKSKWSSADGGGSDDVDAKSMWSSADGGGSDDVDAKSKWSSADGGGSDDDDAKSMWSHRLMTAMMRHQQIFLISLPQRDWLEHLRHIFFGVFHHGVLHHGPNRM